MAWQIIPASRHGFGKARDLEDETKAKIIVLLDQIAESKKDIEINDAIKMLCREPLKIDVRKKYDELASLLLRPVFNVSCCGFAVCVIADL